MSEEKTFIGKGFIWESQYGPMPKMELNVTKLLEYLSTDEGKSLLKNVTFKDGTKNDFIKIQMCSVKEPRSEYDTHYLAIDKYVKEESTAATPAANTSVSDDDLPY